MLSNGTCSFYNNCFMLKPWEKNCVTDYQCLQHKLPPVSCFFFQSPFCILTLMQSPQMVKKLFVLNFIPTKYWNFRSKFCSHLTKFRSKFYHLKQICQVKFCTSAWNFRLFWNNRGQPNFAENITDFHRISSDFPIITFAQNWLACLLTAAWPHVVHSLIKNLLHESCCFDQVMLHR